MELLWGKAQAAGKGRALWRNIVVALCLTGDEEDKQVGSSHGTQKKKASLMHPEIFHESLVFIGCCLYRGIGRARE